MFPDEYVNQPTKEVVSIAIVLTNMYEAQKKWAEHIGGFLTHESVDLQTMHMDMFEKIQNLMSTERAARYAYMKDVEKTNTHVQISNVWVNDILTLVVGVCIPLTSVWNWSS